MAPKFLPPELVRDKETKERFELEAQAAASLSHSHICAILEIEEHERNTFIVMEYVGGRS